MAKYVCSGAKMKCSMGSQESVLDVLPIRRTIARIKGKLMGTIMDHKPIVNIKPFGQCQSLANPTVAAATAACNGKLQKMPCIPNTTTPWMGGKMRVQICGEPTLLDNSKLTCVWAGMIEVTNPGQDFVTEGAASSPSKTKSVKSEKKVADIKAMAEDAAEPEKKFKLTVKDIAEILKKIEEKQGYEAARHYASNHIDYWTMNLLAKKYVDEADEEKKEKEKDNDPNLMPSRFMLLYGADDDELRSQGNMDDYLDKFEHEPEHKVCVKKLREALRILGSDIKETGPFDYDVYFAFMRLYLGRFSRVDLSRYFDEDKIREDAPLEHIAEEHGVFSWKYFEGQDSDRDHESILKMLNPKYGNDLLIEKGADPADYLPGVCYSYPWVPLQLTEEVEDGEREEDEGEDGVTYQIYDRKTMALVGEVTDHGGE